MTIIHKSYKFKLYNCKRLRKLPQFTDACRKVWNKALAINKEKLKAGGDILWRDDLCNLLTQWKKTEVLSWLGKANAQSLQQTIRDLHQAYKDGFDKKQPLKHMPVWKKKGKCFESFRIPNKVKIDGNKIWIPKLGWYKFHKSQDIIGKPKNFTVSETCGDWFVSIMVEINAPSIIHSSSTSVGIDLGIAKHAVLSDGTIYNKPCFKKLEQQGRALQQELARRKEFGKNWYKTKSKLARLEHRIALKRKDYLHKTSAAITKNHSYIVIEDLKVSNMSKSAKGTIDKPGKSVKAKSGLNRSILNQGWGEFRRQLEYKSLWLGGFLKAVNPAYTSQTCSSCTHVNKNNRLTQAKFKCLSCGYIDNADVNAAKNILRVGHQPLALAL